MYLLCVVIYYFSRVKKHINISILCNAPCCIQSDHFIRNLLFAVPHCVATAFAPTVTVYHTSSLQLSADGIAFYKMIQFLIFQMLVTFCKHLRFLGLHFRYEGHRCFCAKFITRQCRTPAHSCCGSGMLRFSIST